MKYVIAIVFVMSSVVAVSGCKQGSGERCQVNSDCRDPLTCNLATLTCQGGTTSDFDADLPIDAPADSPTDAVADAPHD